ncbi:hypothetical protein LguiA_035115 [Lonicera macranthoides]
MEMAVADSNAASDHYSIELYIMDSRRVPVRAAALVPKRRLHMLNLNSHLTESNRRHSNSGEPVPVWRVHPAVHRVGSCNGVIKAAFLEVAFVKVVLAKFGNNFTTGETSKVGGFGFVFTKDAPYLRDISTAILNVSESGTLRHLENLMLSSHKGSNSNQTDYVHDSVGLDSLSALVAITTLTSTLALLITNFWETEEQRALPKEPQ